MTFCYFFNSEPYCRAADIGFLYLLVIVALFWPNIARWLKIKRQVIATCANLKLRPCKRSNQHHDVYAAAEYKQEKFHYKTFKMVAKQVCLEAKKNCRNTQVKACIVWTLVNNYTLYYFAISLNGTNLKKLTFATPLFHRVGNENWCRGKGSGEQAVSFFGHLEMFGDERPKIVFPKRKFWVVRPKNEQMQ